MVGNNIGLCVTEEVRDFVGNRCGDELKDFGGEKGGLGTPNSIANGLWDDIVMGCVCADNIFWKPEYELIENEESLPVWGSKLKQVTGLDLNAVNDVLVRLNIRFECERVPCSKGENIHYLLNNADIVKAMSGLTNEDLITGEGAEIQVLKVLNRLWIIQCGIDDGRGAVKKLNRLLKRYDLNTKDFLMNVITFRKDPNAVSIAETPRFLGFIA